MEKFDKFEKFDKPDNFEIDLDELEVEKIEPEEPAMTEEAEPAVTPEKKKKKKEKAEPKAKSEKKKKAAPAVKPVPFFGMLKGVIALLLPLLYLFFDLFVAYSDFLFQVDSEGNTALSRFMRMALNPAFSSNSISELCTEVFGEGAVPIVRLSVGAAGAGGVYALPLLVTGGCVALAALAGIAVLLSRGRVLTKRLGADLVLLFGLSGAFAPLVGKIVYQFSAFADGATHNPYGLELSVEAILLALIFALCLPSAYRRLRRLGDEAAGRTHPVILPAHILGRGFLLSKLLTLALVPVVALFVMLFLTRGVYYPAIESVSGDLMASFETLKGAFSAGSDTPIWLAALPTAAEAMLAVQVVLLLLFCIPVLFRWLRILFKGRRISAEKWEDEMRSPSGDATARKLRRVLLTPFATLTGFTLISTVLILFLSGMFGHLNFADIETTLNAIYLTLAYTGRLCGVTPAYTLFLLAGSPYWHLTGGLHNAMCSYMTVKPDRD